MTIDLNKPPDVPDDKKPDLTLAMELAQYMKEEMGKFEKSVREQVGAALQANAQTVKRIEGIEGQFQAFRGELDQRATERADKDYREAEARFLLAKEQKDRLTTQEKIDVNQLLEDREASARKARADRWKARLEKWAENAAGAMILAITVPVGLAIVVVILRFILSVLGIPLPDLTP